MLIPLAVASVVIAIFILLPELLAWNEQLHPTDIRKSSSVMILILVGLGILVITKSIPYALSAVCGCLGTQRAYSKHMETKRQRLLSDQLVDALRNLSSSVQAGLSLTQGVIGMASELPNPLGAEFKRVHLEVSLGTSITEALASMSERCNNADVRMFVIAISIQAQTGGNLSPILTNIANVIRERQKLAEKLNAATAQGKLSGLVITCIPPFMFLIIGSMQPGYFEPLLTTTIGAVTIAMMVLMNIIGGIWVLRVSSPKQTT